MKRGIINLTNLELKSLYDLITIQNQIPEGVKEKLLTKLTPVDDEMRLASKIESAQEYDVLISGEEAEIILDSMSAPSDDDSPNLISARSKIQQFLLR